MADPQILDGEEVEPETNFYVPTEAGEDLVEFIQDHTERWRDYRNENHMDSWERYERVFAGKWAASDSNRQSERSRVISPATQQAVETRHAEVMEAVFGQGEFFDIKDDDKNGLDVEKLKNQLNEDFSRDKIRKSIDHIELMAEIYGTGIGEIVVGEEKVFRPATMPLDQATQAYGVMADKRVFVRLNPVNPKNFLFDPNGTSVDDCMGVAIERYTSIHKIAEGIASGKYRNVDVGALYKDDSLEPTQEDKNYKDDKVLLMTYYGLVPRECLVGETQEMVEFSEDVEEYSDMVEAVVVIANGELLLKAEESPYMMKDRPILTYQDDTVPNRLLGRGTVEKAFNMQSAIDGSMRSHMDSLALTVSPMIAVDATRLPRGAKFEVKPGKAFMTNGAPNEIIYPFQFGTNDGAAMNTSKEFERMLLMATGTVDSNGQVTQVARDGMDMATANMIKKYKRALVNIQEDSIIPFVNKAAWRYMQFDPERYPSADVKFMPTATLGIIAREYEQKQLAFLIQTLGAQSPLTPILMQAVVKNSSLSNREEMLVQLEKAAQPDPQRQQIEQQAAGLELADKQAKTAKTQAETQQIAVETQLAPDIAKAKVLAALSNNLNEDNEGADFERRARIADLMMKEKDLNLKAEDIASNERIAEKQMALRDRDSEYLTKASEIMQ